MDEWTETELRAAVQGYLRFLQDEQAGRQPSKAEMRARLLNGPLAGRTPGSVEYRMQNISSVLEDMGRPWIDGYKPASNVGPRNEARLRSFIEEADSQPASEPRAARGGTTIEPSCVYVANFGLENFEWPGCLRGNYIATMQDERSNEYWAAGDREGYIRFAMENLQTARGLPPIKPVASRWYNLATIITESVDDLWLHKQGDQLWWTVTTDGAPSISVEPDPSARPGESPNAVYYRKPCRPWSNLTLRGNRLDWRALHPKSHDFFATEATLQQLGPSYAAFATALINGEPITAWTEQKDWREKAAARGKNVGGKVFSRQEIAVFVMVRTAMATTAHANGQQELRTIKNKEMRFPSAQAFQDYVLALIEAQEGLCALTGIPLHYDDREDPHLCCSLDRRDSDGHYEPGNLQVVCRFINRWKSDARDQEFRRLLQMVRETD